MDAGVYMDTTRVIVNW